ncbi:MAG: hypothetical protein QOG54_1435 [Actinomycetota bacterium]|jgi:hypothetical protein|nr:hypothetical protein [Actinomycetota bacterium]
MKGRKKSLIAVAAVAGLITAALGTGIASAGKPKANPLKGEGVNMKIIANIPWKSGSDMEFATIKGRDYAFAGSFASINDGGGLHVIDITDPEHVKEAAWLKCPVYQSDIQISADQKTVIMGVDSTGGPEACLAANRIGFMTVDITNPLKPKPVGMADIPRGSHNITAHPKLPLIYNSDSDVGNVRGEVQIWSIKNPAKPELVNTIMVPGHSTHDISFNTEGTRAVTAGVDDIEMLDTTDPENPTLASIMHCPGCSIIHDAKFTPDGKTVIVGDEGGGGSAYPCPGGALYFYDVVETPAAPVLALKGMYEPQEVALARDGQSGPQACTSHVFDISDDGTKVAISWYSAGSRYLDVSKYTGVTVGANSTPDAVKELGWFMPDGGVTWSSKFYKGPYIYSNDEQRGFDVFRITKP